MKQTEGWEKVTTWDGVDSWRGDIWPMIEMMEMIKKKKKEAAMGREAIEQWEYQVEGSIMAEPSLRSSVNTRWPLWLQYSERAESKSWRGRWGPCEPRWTQKHSFLEQEKATGELPSCMVPSAPSSHHLASLPSHVSANHSTGKLNPIHNPKFSLQCLGDSPWGFFLWWENLLIRKCFCLKIYWNLPVPWKCYWLHKSHYILRSNSVAFFKMMVLYIGYQL